MFVVPVFKNVGFLTVFIQFQHPYCLITSLKQFQDKGMHAMPFLTLTFFTGLNFKKFYFLFKKILFFI